MLCGGLVKTDRNLKKDILAGSRIGQQWGSNKCANTAFGSDPSSPSPPLLKDQTTTVILLDNFQIAQRAERDSMQHIFILTSCQIASVSHQFQKAKEDLK